MDSLENNDLGKELAPVIQEANGIVIDDDQTFGIADDFLVKIKTAKNKINEVFDPMVEQTHGAWKTALAQKKQFFEPLDQAEKAIKYRMAAYVDEQEKIRMAEQMRQEAELRKAAAEEAQLRAAELKAAGDQEAAAEVIQQAQEIQPVVILPKATPKIEGQSQKKVWKFSITDATKINPQFMIPNESAIGASVRSLGDKAVQVVGAGIKVWQETQIGRRV